MKSIFLFLPLVAVCTIISQGCGQSLRVEEGASSSNNVSANSSVNQDLLSQIILANSSSSRDGLSSAIRPESSTRLSSSSQVFPATTSLQGLRVLANLTDITLPAVGDEGITLLQTQTTGIFGIRNIAWDGTSSWPQTDAGIYFAYTTASTTHSASLLQKSTSSWTIIADGSLSLGTSPVNYKEALASNENQIFWVDYGIVSTVPTAGRPKPTVKGQILSQTWIGGAIDTLSDNIPYRARLDASASHLAWVEYPVGALVGKIALMDLGTGSVIYPSPSSSHQDRPAVDGDYVVWEEYLGDSNAVIRSYQISTGLTQDLSSRTGFRTSPDILGPRVVWEDQRTGNGDIWMFDLSQSLPEQILVSGAGHSTGARLWGNKLIWIESSPTAMGLVQASW
jgi:beta propeller repeat protein